MISSTLLYHKTVFHHKNIIFLPALKLRSHLLFSVEAIKCNLLNFLPIHSHIYIKPFLLLFGCRGIGFNDFSETRCYCLAYSPVLSLQHFAFHWLLSIITKTYVSPFTMKILPFSITMLFLLAFQAKIFNRVSGFFYFLLTFESGFLSPHSTNIVFAENPMPNNFM